MVSRPRLPLTTQILLGLLLGLATGLVFAQYKIDAGPLGEIGTLVIQAIKVAATPLLLLAVINAVLTADVKAKSGLRMMLLATVNATIALGFGLALSNLLRPGRHLAHMAIPAGKAVAAQSLEPMKVIGSLVPTSLVQPFAENSTLPLVGMALLLGLALRGLKNGGEDTSVVEQAFRTLLRVAETVLGWIINVVPLAVFAVVTKAVAEYGVAPFVGLAWYVGVGLLGLVLHPLITYQLWLALFARLPLRRFWREAREPIVYAAGANSSLATLPLTLKALDRLGVSKASSALGACVGTNLNNDGIILYEAMAVLFVAQAHGLDLTLGQQAVAALTCLVAAMGIAGVPEAGFVSLAVVLVTVGLPVDLLPLLLTVDWVLARGRSVVNVLSDMMVSILLDRCDGHRFDGASAPAAALDVAPTA
jgi:DAACS family dicarboxylate/amino acid:cation (Na+ or H+) symporter